MFLTDFTFTCDSKPVFLSGGGGLLNVERLMLVGEKLRSFLMFQGRMFPSHVKPNVDLRDAMLNEPVLEQNELFVLSRLREGTQSYNITTNDVLQREDSRHSRELCA